MQAVNRSNQEGGDCMKGKYGKTIKPYVRADGISFVDGYHFGNGTAIMSCVCDKCGNTVKEFCQHGEDCKRQDESTIEVTLGFYGPNGNGYNYWCRKCGGRMTPKG